MNDFGISMIMFVLLLGALFGAGRIYKWAKEQEAILANPPSQNPPVTAVTEHDLNSNNVTSNVTREVAYSVMGEETGVLHLPPKERSGPEKVALLLAINPNMSQREIARNLFPGTDGGGNYAVKAKGLIEEAKAFQVTITRRGEIGNG